MGSLDSLTCNCIVDDEELNEENDLTDYVAKQENLEKLCRLFPEKDKAHLSKIFAWNAFNFQETVEDLRDSLRNAPKEFTSSNKKLSTNQLKSKNNCNQTTKEDSKRLENLRGKMSDYREVQKYCTRKAQEAFEAKQHYNENLFRNLAILSKKKVEKMEHEAANLIVENHKKSNSEFQLDLHFLTVPAAISSLEIFLDENIEKLRSNDRKFQKLTIITGRGKHSVGGVAKIKVETERHLQKRKLQ